MPDSKLKDLTVGPHAQGAGASHSAKQDDDTALLPIPIPRHLLAELPQFGEDLPQYVEGVIETSKRRGELEKIWLRVLSKESKARLAEGDERTWNEIADFVDRVEPLESLFGGDAPAPLKDRIKTFDEELMGVSDCIVAAQFSGGSQDDVDKLYESLKKIMPALKLISGRCEQRARQILVSFDRCNVKIQDAVDRARSALDAAGTEQRYSDLEKVVTELDRETAAASATWSERPDTLTRRELSGAEETTVKHGESSG